MKDDLTLESAQKKCFEYYKHTGRTCFIIAEATAWDALWKELEALALPGHGGFRGRMRLSMPQGEVEIVMFPTPGRNWAIVPRLT